MKFGKLLKLAGDGFPECDGLFLRYKELKKQLKSMKKSAEDDLEDHADEAGAQEESDTTSVHHEPSAVQEATSSGQQQAQQHAPEMASTSQLSPDEQEFVRTLNEDLSRFNRFFMEKEEDAVIVLQALSDRLSSVAAQGEDAKALKAALVDFHGEMVLLLHWSLLNYAAVVKILKKHDKRTGLLLRAPYLANVLQQPFYSTSVMSRLVKRAEEHIKTLVGMQQAAAAQASSAQSEQLPVDTQVFRRTAAALETWNTLCSNASTPSTVLPDVSSELVRQLRMREEWARLTGVDAANAAIADCQQQHGRKRSIQQAITGADCMDADKRARPTASSDEDEGSVDS